MALVFGCCWYVLRGKYLSYEVDFHVPLKMENPGVSLDVVELPCSRFATRPCFEPAPTGIRVTTPNTIFIMRSLADLRGSVTIRNGSDALQYARIATSRDLFYTGLTGALEVVSRSQAQQPGYADTGKYHRDGKESGLFGVISDADYAAEGFQPPVVTAQGNTFHIKRWVCTFEDLDGKTIQMWDETIGRDGSYRCAVIKSKPIPKRPGQSWYVYGLM